MMDLFKITETIIITSSYIEKCKKNKFKFVNKLFGYNQQFYKMFYILKIE